MNIPVSIKKIACRLRIYSPTVEDILIEAREILVKKGWTQGTMARNDAKLAVGTRDKTAVSFCSAGAINKALYNYGVDPWAVYKGSDGRDAVTNNVAYQALKAIYTSDMSVAAWNDDPFRSKADVLAVFDKAIEAQK